MSAAAIAAVVAITCAAATGAAPADTVRQSEYFLAEIHAVQAWRTTQGAGVTVAILADGVSGSQADIAGTVTHGPSFVRPAGKAGKARKAAAATVGTGLASLIAGHGHGTGRASGVIGIAPAARVLSIAVTLGPGDPRWSQTKLTSRLPDAIAAGIRFAVQHGATVIALPADPGLPGPPGAGNSPAASGGSSAERAAVGYALSKNVVLIAPAGDNAKAGGQPAYPAAYRGVIAVGALGKSNARLPTSSTLGYVTLTAPGQRIVAAAPSGYQTMNGTWAASALVAGIAALVRSQFPNLTAGQVRTALVAGAASAAHGSRIADAAGALNAASTMSPPHAQPAMLSARPRTLPVMPSVPTGQSVIARDLLRDGMMSGALLILLLIPVFSYSEIARRRERRAALLAEREKWSQRGDEPANDPLLEFFRPQHARPPVAQPRPQLTPRYTATSMAAARPVRSIAGQIVPVSAVPTGVAGPAPFGAGSSAFLPSGRSLFGAPAERPSSPHDPGSVVSHRPVTGSPPWEPAPRPTSDLPWTHGSAESTSIAQPLQSLQPLPAPTPPPPSGPPEWLWGESERTMPIPSPVTPGPVSQPTGRDSGSRPIYVWNPPAESAGRAGPPWPDQPVPWDADPRGRLGDTP
jgi:hypothetical protein